MSQVSYNKRKNQERCLLKPTTHTKVPRCILCYKSHLSMHQHYQATDLDLCHGVLHPRRDADIILRQCESEIDYFSGDLAKLKVYGKWRDIPRKQAAFGDVGLSYTFSGLTVPAKPWPEFLAKIRDRVSTVTGCQFNFVLVNRYDGGNDHIGEHRDDERDLDSSAPIASVSFGRSRDFLLRHKSVRLKLGKVENTDNVRIELKHGELLVMNVPTNKHWYHSLPKQRNALGVRVNMTFRKMCR